MRCRARCWSKSSSRKKRFSVGVLHARRVGKAHVVFDERENLAGLVVGEAEAAADFGAHGDADLDMAVEADAVGGDAEGGRLADVVQQRAPGERERAAGLKLVKQQQRVDPHIALGMELRRLCDALHARDFGQNFCEQAGFIEQFEGAAGMAFGEHFGQFVAHALAADGVDTRGESADGGECCRFDLEAEARGEADGAQQAQLVFFKAAIGLADGADDAGIEIGETADVVDHGRAQRRRSAKVSLQRAACTQWIEEQAVDGEVAALDVFVGAERVADLVGMAAVGVGAVGAEGRNLGHERFLGRGFFSSRAAASAPPQVATSTTPKCAPTAKVRGNISRTTSGVAEVATS